MDDWKVRVQYINKYDVHLDKTEKQARKIFVDLKSKMYEKQIVWCELIYAPIDAEEKVIDSFENKVVSIMGHKVIV